MAVTERAMGLLLTPAKLRVWGWRSAMSLIDQGLTSGAGFAVNLLLARWMPAEVYGAFAVAFAGFLFVFGFYNVLLLEPMTVFGPSRYPTGLASYFRTQIRVHLILVTPLSAFALVASLALRVIMPQSPLSGAVLGAGLMLPFLLLLWLARRMCYVLQTPSMSVTSSALYLSLVLAGLFALKQVGWAGALTCFLLMGCAGLLASGVLVWRLGLLNGRAGAAPVKWRAVLSENWSYGRLLAASTVLSSVSNQTQTFLAAAILGLGAAGVLRAMQLPSLVMTQVVFAAGLLVLPSFSYDFGNRSLGRLRNKATLASMALGVGGLCFAALLALFSKQTEQLLFGGKYVPYIWLMPILALAPTALGISTGYSMAMRASQKPGFDLVANAIAAPVGVFSAILFMRWWGVFGAAASMALSFAVYALTVTWIYYFARQAA